MKRIEKLYDEIKAWSLVNKDPYDAYLMPLDNFWRQLENGESVQLESGLAGYRALEVDFDEATGVFELDGKTYAVKGSYNSWGSEFDAGPFRVEPEDVVVVTWVVHEDAPEPELTPDEEFFTAVLNTPASKSLTEIMREAVEAVKESKVERDSYGRRIS